MIGMVLGGFQSRGSWGSSYAGDIDIVNYTNYFAYLYLAISPTGTEGFLINQGYNLGDANHNSVTQYFIQYDDGKRVTRTYNWDTASWSAWKEYSFDIPSFYKDYSTLAELKAALGL